MTSYTRYAIIDLPPDTDGKSEEKKKAISMSKHFKAGVAREKITPPLGTLLYGYPTIRAAESVHDDLYLTAVALEGHGVRAIMISADICAYGEEEIFPLCKEISKATGVDESHITFSCTHTHSAPCTRFSAGWGDKNTDYINGILNPAAIRASVRAVEELTEAQVGYGTVDSLVGVNRRERRLNGSVALGQCPYGIFNKEMTVISLRRPSGEGIGCMIHYGAHCTAAGALPVITRDWAGIMVDELERESGMICAFFGGPSGDTGPRLSNGKTTGDIALMEELGALAGRDAVAAYRAISEYATPDLKVIADSIHIPYEPLMSCEEARSELGKLLEKAPYERLEGADKKAAKKYSDVIEHYEKGLPEKREMVYPVTSVSIGDIAFCPFPFEVFGEIAIRIAQHSPFKKTLVLNNTNGSHAYFPTESEIPLGGYEVFMFGMFQTFTPIKKSDCIAVNEYLRVLGALKQ